MRVVAGEFRGRRLAAPHSTSTRPTSDRVREAVFSSLTSLMGADLGGGAALDAFAGSGALGIEALSRGMSSATFVESDPGAVASVRANLDALGAADRARVVAGDALTLAARNALPGGPFALLLLDPPYRLALADVTGLVVALAASEQIEGGATVVLEHAGGVSPDWPAGFELVRRRAYGSTEVDIAVYARGAGGQ